MLKQIPELEPAANGVEPVIELTPVQATGDTLWYLIRRAWIVVLFAAIAAAAAGFVSKDRPKQYEATATVLINQGSSVSQVLDPGSAKSSSDPERDINTQVELITLPAVAERVVRDAHLGGSVDDALDDVSTKVRGTSNLVEIKARRGVPVEARDMAQGFATQYVALIAERWRAAVDGAITRTSEQLRALAGRKGAATERRALRRELRELRLAEVTSTPTASIVDQARLPRDAVSPRPVRDALLVALGAAIIGIVALLSLRAIAQSRRLSS